MKPNMTPSEIIAAARKLPLADSLGKEAAQLLRLLADELPRALTRDGTRVLDPSDFRLWLEDLAEESEKK